MVFHKLRESLIHNWEILFVTPFLGKCTLSDLFSPWWAQLETELHCLIDHQDTPVPSQLRLWRRLVHILCSESTPKKPERAVPCLKKPSSDPSLLSFPESWESLKSKKCENPKILIHRKLCVAWRVEQSGWMVWPVGNSRNQFHLLYKHSPDMYYSCLPHLLPRQHLALRMLAITLSVLPISCEDRGMHITSWPFG